MPQQSGANQPASTRIPHSFLTKNTRHAIQTSPPNPAGASLGLPLPATRRQGVEIQMYLAVVGILLLYLSSDAKPSKYSYVLFYQVMQGQATLEEVLPILARREGARTLERPRTARTRAGPTAPKRRYGLSSRRE